jgi:hypothetical protein
MRVALQPITHTLLKNRSFDIEFMGFLSNHAKHALIALNGLEAPASRVEAYWNEYTTLTPYDLQLHPCKDWDQAEPAKEEDLEQWRGQKVHWQNQVLFFQEQMAEKSTDDLVRKYVPDLLPGMTGALTHALIHLGWALDANSEWMILEGLAYLNFASVPIDETRLEANVHNEATPLDSFERVAQSWQVADLQTTWVNRVKAAYDESFHSELVQAGFQWHVAKLVHEPHAISTELPTWLEELDLPKLWEVMYRDICYLFLATRDEQGHGNFVVLHLLTSLWALENICDRLDESTTRRALGFYYSMTITLLSAGSSGFPSPNLLKQIREDYPDTARDEASLDWTTTVNKGIAQEEEHNIKLVYVMRELWMRYGHWQGYSVAATSFTLTPDVSGLVDSKPTFA